MIRHKKLFEFIRLFEFLLISQLIFIGYFDLYAGLVTNKITYALYFILYYVLYSFLLSTKEALSFEKRIARITLVERIKSNFGKTLGFVFTNLIKGGIVFSLFWFYVQNLELLLNNTFCNEIQVLAFFCLLSYIAFVCFLVYLVQRPKKKQKKQTGEA